MQKRYHFGEVGLQKKGGSIKEFIAKLSRGLMLPIAILPVAGLMLGVGSTIISQTTVKWATIIGNIMMYPGSVIFAILPLLFAIAIAIAFTSDSGIAGLSATIGYCVFIIFQRALIMDRPDGYYDFLWYHFSTPQFDSLFTDILGIKTLSSSIFGGLLVGGIVAILYNRYRNIQLPKILGFFSGVRFIPIVTFFAVSIFSLFFSIVWPMIGLGLYYAGGGLSQLGKYGGLNSLLFGVFNRVLCPFGLHHILDTSLWFTSIGGSLNTHEHFYYLASDGVTWIDSGIHYSELAGDADYIYTGDINIQIEITKMIGNIKDSVLNSHHAFRQSFGSDKITINDIIQSYNYFHNTNNILVNPNPDSSLLAVGQYTNFAYIFTLFGLPCAALAMTYAAPKGESRKLASSIVIPAGLISMLTGITEPLEFTFLFLAPWLFWGFHAIMAGIAGMITTIFIYYVPNYAPHVTFSFSSGLLDFVIYGVMPDARGGATNCWMILCFAVLYGPIYFIVFSWAIRKWDIHTPGRGSTTKLFSKQDWVKKHSDEPAKPKNIKEKSMQIITAYGTPSNILNIDACITKLRIQVKDKTKVDVAKLKELGALGVMYPSPQSVYAVFGPEADIIKNNMKDIINKGEYKDATPTTPIAPTTIKH